jgi:excisionase family DNA binding protein
LAECFWQWEFDVFDEETVSLDADPDYVASTERAWPSSRDKISLQEACDFLECSHPKLKEMLHDGDIPGIKLGKAWVIPRVAFLSAVNAMAVGHLRAVEPPLQADRRRAPKSSPGKRRVAEAAELNLR